MAEKAHRAVTKTLYRALLRVARQIDRDHPSWFDTSKNNGAYVFIRASFHKNKDIPWENSKCQSLVDKGFEALAKYNQRLQDLKLQVNLDNEVERIMQLSHVRHRLEECAFVVSRIIDPNSDIDSAKAVLDEIALHAQEDMRDVAWIQSKESAHTYLPTQDTLVVALEKLRERLFKQLGLRGGYKGVQDFAPLSNLCEVLKTGQGIPVSLGVVFLAVAGRLGLHVQGVNTPGHFMLKIFHADGALFLDPLNGTVLSESDLVAQMDKAGIPQRMQELSLKGANEWDVTTRMLNNLIIANRKLCNFNKAAWYQDHLIRLLAAYRSRKSDGAVSDEEDNDDKGGNIGGPPVGGHRPMPSSGGGRRIVNVGAMYADGRRYLHLHPSTPAALRPPEELWIESLKRQTLSEDEQLTKELEAEDASVLQMLVPDLEDETSHPFPAPSRVYPTTLQSDIASMTLPPRDRGALGLEAPSYRSSLE